MKINTDAKKQVFIEIKPVDGLLEGTEKPVDFNLITSFEEDPNLVYFRLHEEGGGQYSAYSGNRAFEFSLETHRWFCQRKVWVRGKRKKVAETYDFRRQAMVKSEEESCDGVYYEAGTNDIRLAIFDREKHTLTQIQVSLVAQGGKVYIIQQQKAFVTLYRDGQDKIAWEGRIRREVMIALLKLPELQKVVIEPVRVPFKSAPKPKHNFSEMEARLDWWDHARQVGVLKVWRHGKFVNAKVHWREAPLGEDGRRYCEEGNIFKVRELVRPQTETSLEWEAREVTAYKPDPEYPPVRICIVEIIDPKTLGVLDAFRNSLARK